MSARVLAVILAIAAAFLLLPRLMAPGAFMPAQTTPPPTPKQSSAEKARDWIGVVSGGIAAIGSAFGGFSRAPSSNNETIQV